MAKGLNELIAYLRGEIALCGQLGASPADILTFINAFYSQDVPTSSSSGETGREQAIDEGEVQCEVQGVVSGPSPPVKQSVDRRFQEKVWTWITKDPEVSIFQGKTAKRKSLTLADAEARSGPSAQQDGTTETDEHGVRLFVSDERTWHAIAGHGIDLKRIPQMEYELLSIIAAHKEQGILQGDLTRLSGQDKRSVPPRTHQLAKKGYIDKRPVKTKGNTTSLLIHYRYKGSNAVKEREELDVKFMDYSSLLPRIFDILKVEHIMTHDDLKARLGMGDPQRARNLSRAIRKLERIGVVKRVRAASEQSRLLRTTHRCVKLVREPNLERDLELFHRDRKKPVVTGVDENSDSESEAEGQVAEEQADEEIQRAEPLRAGSNELQEVVVSRLPPEWSADRMLNNILFDVVNRSGAEGISQMKITAQIFGGFFRRPVEAVMSRLVQTWLVSQPLHLRHLALIRDTEMTKSVHHFIHFSFGNFKQKVDQGQAFWEAVVTAPPGTKRRSKSALASDPNSQADVDQYGFPTTKPRYSQYKNGNASFRDCLRISDPDQYVLSIFDPLIKELPDGATDIVWPKNRDGEIRKGPSRSALTRAGLHRKVLKPKIQALGRPKKYPVGEEAYWQAMKRRKQARGTEMTQLVHSTEPETPRTAVEGSPAANTFADDDSTHQGRPVAELIQAPDGAAATVVATAPSTPTNGGQARPLKRARKQAKKFGETFDHSTLPVPESVDDKWNEAVGRFMDRSNPGVYLSPRGRRKPDGKKGRPPLSRIAIFKTTRLSELPWFAPQKSRKGGPRPRPVAIPAAFRVQATDQARPPLSLPQPRKLDWVISEAFETSIYPKCRFLTSSAAHSHSLSLYAFNLAQKSEFSVQAGAPMAPKILKRKASTPDKPTDTAPAFPLDNTPVLVQEHDNTVLSAPSSSTAPATKRMRLSPPKTAPAEAIQSRELLGSDSIMSAPLTESLARDVPSTEAIMVDVPATVRLDVQSDHLAQQPLVSESLAGTSLTPTVRDPVSGDPPADDYLASDPMNLDDAPSGGPSKADSFSQSVNFDGNLAQIQEIIVDQADSDEPLPDLEVQENVPTVKIKKPGSRATGHMDPWGGSIAHRRRKILMDIIDKCGGVYPGDHELWYPFSTQWDKDGRDTTVDRRTIKSIIKYFVDNAKLRQLKFSFKDHRNIMVTKAIVTKIEIAPNDPKVKELQKLMIKADPQPYFPPGAEVDPSLRTRSDIRTVKEVRNNPDRRPRYLPLDLNTHVTLYSLPRKYQITEERQMQKEETQRQRALERLLPPKPRRVRRLLPLGSVPTPGALPPRRITLPGKKNVARLQKLNVRLAKPQYSDTPRDIGISQLEYLETEQGRLAPMAGATSLAPHRNMLSLSSQQDQELYTSPIYQPYTFTPHQRRLSNDTVASSSTSASTPSLEAPGQDIIEFEKPLPKSLDEFVFNYKRDIRNLTVRSDDSNAFSKTVDKVLKWELKYPEVFEGKSAETRFINHEMDAALFTTSAVTTRATVSTQRRAERERRKKAEAAKIAAAKRADKAATKRFVQLAFGDPMQLDTPDHHTPVPPIEAFTPLRATLQPANQAPVPVEPPKRRFRRNKVLYSPSESSASETAEASQENSVPKAKKPSHKKKNASFIDEYPETLLHRILMATLVTRTIMGGADSALNWPLMEKLFPDLGLDLLKKLWPVIRKKHDAQIPEMKMQLQERFLEAYEAGDVPSIDFGDAYTYPWDKIVDWAVETIDLPDPSSKKFTLPSSRARLEESYDYVREPRPSSSEMYSGLAYFTVPDRRAVLSSAVFASPGDRDEDAPGIDPFFGIQRPMDEQLLLAKSWIRQNATTQDEVYSSKAAEVTMMKNNGHNLRILDVATRSLNVERVILTRSRHKAAPGRSYDVTEQFTAAIDRRRIITAKMISRASWYKKNVLDQDFAEKGYSDFKTVSDDGDVMAIMHLIEEGLITLSSDDLPKDVLGDYHETRYQTRYMDKKLLHFSLRVHPGPGFATNSSSAIERITLEPPKPRLYSKPLPESPDFTPSLLPLWYDVHGNFFRLMWEMLISDICGLAVMRPGLTIYEIQDQLKPVMELWELRDCTEWMVAVGLLSEQNGRACFRVTRHWWLRLGEYLEGETQWEGMDGETGELAEPIDWLTGFETTEVTEAPDGDVEMEG